MAKLGVFEIIDKRGRPITLQVFSDGLVMVTGGNGVMASGAAVGALGVLIGTLVARNKMKKRMTEVDALGPVDTGSLVAAADITGVDFYVIDSLTAVRVEKGLGKGRKLVVEPTGEKALTLRFADKISEPLVAALQQAAGERFVDARPRPS